METSQPFLTKEGLMKKAKEIWWSLTPNDWLEAFSKHAKIGKIKDPLSKKEQAGVIRADGDVIKDLEISNAEYEKKFGFMFIVFATGKSAKQMHEILIERLQNDYVAEIKIAAAEQEKIMCLRLERLLNP